MDKYERAEAATAILSHVQGGPFVMAELTLACGMRVRWKNTAEAREKVAAKVLKGCVIHKARTCRPPVPASSFRSAMLAFIRDSELDNAAAYADLHNTTLSAFMTKEYGE